MKCNLKDSVDVVKREGGGPLELRLIGRGK